MNFGVVPTPKTPRLPPEIEEVILPAFAAMKLVELGHKPTAGRTFESPTGRGRPRQPGGFATMQDHVAGLQKQAVSSLLNHGRGFGPKFQRLLVDALYGGSHDKFRDDALAWARAHAGDVASMYRRQEGLGRLPDEAIRTLNGQPGILRDAAVFQQTATLAPERLARVARRSAPLENQIARGTGYPEDAIELTRLLYAITGMELSEAGWHGVLMDQARALENARARSELEQLQMADNRPPPPARRRMKSVPSPTERGRKRGTL